ncbi:MAG: DUF2490 domain-containing protein [Gammaproteobacteria bacterium]|nr:DUF2490 domain-containing protein [Gammaproteobacteria bacterium]
MRKFRCFSLIFLIVFCQESVAQVEHHLESWNSAQILGSLSKDKKFKYYIQPQIAFIDRENKFRGAFLFLGLGYRLTPDLIVWLMDGESNIKKAKGGVRQINTIREEIDWHTWQTNPLNFKTTAWANVFRLEERKESSSSQWLFRAREKVVFRTPFKSWKNHSFVAFDETFFDFNHPAWTNSDSFFQQNQLFLGVGTSFSKVAFDLGYLNQYVLNNTPQMNSIIYLIFYINVDVL